MIALRPVFDLRCGARTLLESILDSLGGARPLVLLAQQRHAGARAERGHDVVQRRGTPVVDDHDLVERRLEGITVELADRRRERDVDLPGRRPDRHALERLAALPIKGYRKLDPTGPRPRSSTIVITRDDDGVIGL